MTAYIRNIDGDEGYYLTASRLVMEGKIPYLDFFYPQMPLLPYIYGVWMSVFGFSYFAGRTLSAISSISVGLLLAWYLKKKTQSMKIVYICLLLFMFSGTVISWFTVVKTYALSSFFLIGCFLTLSLWHSNNRNRGYHLLIAGLLLGIASNIRLYVSVVLPVLLIWIFLINFRKINYLQLGRNVSFLITGFILPSFLSIYLFVKDPDAFYFNNLGYHLIRSERGLLSGLLQRFNILFQFISSAQQFLLFLIAIGSCIIIFHLCVTGGGNIARCKDEILALLMLTTLFIVSLLPRPTFVQYFSIIVPFIIILHPPFLNLFLNNISNWSRSFPLILLFIYIILGPPTAYDMTSQTLEWQIGHVSLIGKEIAKVTKRGDHILTWWPGYAFAAGRGITPGMENHFSRDASQLVSIDKAKKFRIARNEDIRNLIRDKGAPLVVYGNWVEFLGNDELHIINAMLQKNYELYKQIGQTKIYLPKNP